ncbi:3336_t:CDS:1 [Paraglomus occultum]|uniref:3336_t:CDS:1 n=1 Tax=Paraglomus occultum TaxID=144539 RepID=A0A9N9GE06_9GLOM|nr:3336_t:CDS:1 [Paraglomus occultum]
MIITLLDVAIPLILETLHDNYACLYNCLFVSKFWCNVAVAILWGSPFTRSIQSANPSLLVSYLKCLSDENKLDLHRMGLETSWMHSSNMFDYPIYLEHLTDFDLRALLLALYPDIDPRTELAAFTLLVRMFMDRSKKLRKLELHYGIDYFATDIYQLCAQRHSQLEYMSISMHHSNPYTLSHLDDEISTLLTNQKGQLKYFGLWHADEHMKAIMNALLKQKSSIETVEFCFCAFNVDSLIIWVKQFPKLLKLIFDNCKGVPPDIHKSLDGMMINGYAAPNSTRIVLTRVM